MKLLTIMVEQFTVKHQGSLPKKIVVEPLALVALGLKRSVAPIWAGVPVECRELSAGEMKKPGTGEQMAVVYDVSNSQLVSFDI